MTEDAPVTVADVDPDRTLWIRKRFRGGKATKAHTDKRCSRIKSEDSVVPKTASVLFDDTDICTLCRGEDPNYKGGGDGLWSTLTDTDPDELGIVADGGDTQ
jgi:hypothetical protein